MANRQAYGGLFSVVLLGSAALLSGCAEAPLVPVSPSDDGVATVSKAGIELRAEVQAGSHTVSEALTPIKISIRNTAPSRVYVGLDDIELVADGRPEEPVPPEGIRPRRPVGLGIDPASPYASSQGPANGPTGAASGTGGLVVEPSVAYGSGTAGPRQAVKREIEAGAFNGGFIASGETQHGVVYFHRPPGDVGQAKLRVRVRPEQGLAPLETLEIVYAGQT